MLPAVSFGQALDHWTAYRHVQGTLLNTEGDQMQQRKVNEDQILAELLDRANDWAWETAIAYGGKPHTPLVLNNEWQPCGYKQSYIGSYGFYPDNTPFLHVTYHHFKHGSVKFPYRETYAEILKNHAGGKAYTPKTRTVTQDSLTSEEATAKQAIKEDMLKHFLAADQALWDDGVENLPYLHSYWKAKGFAQNIVDPSIRYSLISPNKDSAYPQMVIMAKVIGIDGALKGFQRIGEDGTKYLTPGMPKKSHFIILGTSATAPEKLKEVFTAEGLATGATVRLALENKTPVIATLDAGNIEPVVNSLREKYGTKSKCAITICADNDQWKALEIDPVTKKPKPNTGLTKAHPVALRHRCKIVSPSFVGLDASSLPTDFNDLIQLAGIDEVKRQLALAKRPNLHLAITQESLEQERKRLRQQFFGHKVVSINERYIPDEIPDEEDGNIRKLSDLVFNHKVSLFRCPKDTGKTTAIGRLLRQHSNYSSLFITHTISLATNLASRLNIENYVDYQGMNNNEYAELHELRQLSICLNSLFKLLNKNDKLVRNVDVVVLDEVSQVIRAVTSKHVKNKTRVFSALKQLIQSAKHLILMDADLDSVTLGLLKQWLPEEQYFVLLNEYKPAKGKNIIFYDHPGMIAQKALEAISNGQRAFIATNSRLQARQLFDLLQAATKKHGLYIASDNGGSKAVQRFFENVNREALNYDFIVASPSVTSGISIDDDIFGFVGGIFESDVNTPSDCTQALGRVRQANKFHVYVSDIKQALPTTDEEISAKWVHTHKHDEKLLSFEDISNDELIDVAQDYKKLCILAAKEANFARQDFLARFAKLCILDGYNVAYSDSTPEIEAEGKFLQAEAEDLEKLEFIEGVTASKTPNDEEYNQLKSKPRKTLEETWTLEKKELTDFYVLDEEAPQEVIKQTVEDDRRGKGRKEISNLEIALASDTQIQQMRKEETKTGIELEPDRRAFATEREAYQQILSFAGINTELIADESTYSAETLLNSFVPWILSRYWVLKGIFPRLARPEQIERDPVRVFGTMLGRLGLSQHRLGKHKQNAEYSINLAQLEKRRELIIKRGKIPIKPCKGAFDVYKNIETTNARTFPKTNNRGGDDRAN